MNAERSEVSIQNLMGPKAPFMPSEGTSRSPAEGGLTASVSIIYKNSQQCIILT